MIRGLFISVFILLGVCVLGAERHSDTAIQHIHIRWDNDFLFKTDHNYTNGLEIKYSSLNYHYRVLQHLFTPKELYTPEIQYDDRPYAAYLLGGIERWRLDDMNNRSISYGLFFGVIGPLAGGEFVQNGTHDILWTSRPAEGWHNQISNDLCISFMYNFKKSLWNRTYVDVYGDAYAIAGSPYTKLESSIGLMFGRLRNPYASLEFDKKSDWQLYTDVSFHLIITAFDATLQGGLFNNTSPHTVGINPVMGRIDCRFVLTYKKIGVEFGLHAASPDHPDGLNHNWGHWRVFLGF